ncbi:hypothetical protein EVAR_63015_1 [Eumeta japonica]|uniref:Uncharacterized protein n=1 Tax=Eumeta variegata TaxID=151549 RepID=A0A4C1YVK0_EUMVA|nr:hypothetical protein EVAR_63015_1 [Eumeta japonica]
MSGRLEIRVTTDSASRDPAAGRYRSPDVHRRRLRLVAEKKRDDFYIVLCLRCAGAGAAFPFFEFKAPRPFLLLRRVPTLRYCDALVMNFTAAKFRA